jgi:hypothetical protein
LFTIENVTLTLPAPPSVLVAWRERGAEVNVVSLNVTAAPASATV